MDWELIKNTIDDSIDQEKISCFIEFLIEENKKYNLTAITKEEDITIKHIIDSLYVVKIIDFTNVNSILDVGTGAGFPGIILAIYFPNKKFTLLDSNNKKINFLKIVVEKLSLRNVTLIHSRVEEYENHQFDLVISRAVSSIPILFELCYNKVNLDGKILMMKGATQENKKINIFDWNSYGFNIPKIYEYELPLSYKRRLVLIKKTKHIENKKRHFSLIKKKPLF